MRYFIELTYEGTAYHGWQVQKNASSVQEILNESLSTILGEKIEVTGSGRTDTGVHALQQVAHFDTEGKFREERLVFKLNSFLPRDIAVRSIRKVVPEAHARYDAVSRGYEYRITRIKDPFLVRQAFYYRKELDLQEMNKVCDVLKTIDDFKSFSKVKTDVNHYRCKVGNAGWKKTDSGIFFTIEADRFLRGMVRALVGTMISIGEGKLDRENFEHIIASGDRKKAGASVPAHGLYLSQVAYPESIYFEER